MPQLPYVGNLVGLNKTTDSIPDLQLSYMQFMSITRIRAPVPKPRPHGTVRNYGHPL